MRIHLIAVGTRMPAWINAGYEGYAVRLPRECEMRLVEIPPSKRVKNASVVRLRREEGKRILAAIPRGAHVIALEVTGRQWNTEQLADRLSAWLAGGRDLALLVGGPDGLDCACLDQADSAWSLSKLTLPHPLVRIIVAEQFYRAWSILQHHPYHRT
jgi:23S rRNA (pseudouridine1915-N3)-methyltransferase